LPGLRRKAHQRRAVGGDHGEKRVKGGRTWRSCGRFCDVGEGAVAAQINGKSIGDLGKIGGRGGHAAFYWGTKLIKLLDVDMRKQGREFVAYRGWKGSFQMHRAI